MQALGFQTPHVLVLSIKKKGSPFFAPMDSLPFCPLLPISSSLNIGLLVYIVSTVIFWCFGYLGRGRLIPWKLKMKKVRGLETPKLKARSRTFRAHALNVGSGSSGYEEIKKRNDSHRDDSSKIKASPYQVPYLFPTAIVLCAFAVGFLILLFIKGPSSVLPALAKSGFTAAFSLIFVSEIGDKTFFIAALLAMQYEKVLVLLGSMGALSLMTILSVIIGRIFHAVPAQFQTTFPIGEYAAVTLLMFFGLKSIKDAWDLPSATAKIGEPESKESDEFVEAEELVKENMSKRLSNPPEIIWKSFSLVFFAEGGDRSMLATIALGAAQSPWGVASGAIAGHLLATAIAILGGALLAKYISEKLVGYIGGVLFLVFAVATFFGVF